MARKLESPVEGGPTSIQLRVLKVGYRPCDSQRGIYKYMWTACQKDVFWTCQWIKIGMFDPGLNRANSERSQIFPCVKCAHWHQLASLQDFLIAGGWNLIVHNLSGITSCVVGTRLQKVCTQSRPWGVGGNCFWLGVPEAKGARRKIDGKKKNMYNFIHVDGP